VTTSLKRGRARFGRLDYEKLFDRGEFRVNWVLLKGTLPKGKLGEKTNNARTSICDHKTFEGNSREGEVQKKKEMWKHCERKHYPKDIVLRDSSWPSQNPGHRKGGGRERKEQGFSLCEGSHPVVRRKVTIANRRGRKAKKRRKAQGEGVESSVRAKKQSRWVFMEWYRGECQGREKKGWHGGTIRRRH